MKKLVVLPMIPLILFIFISCNKDDEENKPNVNNNQQTVDPYLKITNSSGSGDNIILNWDGGTINVWIESNIEWVCAVGGDSNLKLKVDKTKGYGNDVVVISYESTRNKTFDYNLLGTFTIQWVNKYGSKSYESITLVRHRNPSWY